MVFFTCGGCGESLKKAQVDRHRWRCTRSSLMSCVDCHADFHGDQYQAHTKCLTEDQKYGGRNYVAKESKGEVKQEKWLQQVQRAIDALANGHQDRALRSALEQVRNFPNIPRKQQKFESFLKNSLRIRDQRVISQAWAAISSAAKEQESVATTNGAPVEIKKRHTQDEQDHGPERKKIRSDDQQTNGSAAVKFGWRKAIKARLKEAPGNEVKTKKLRKDILAQYKSQVENGTSTEDELSTIFQEAVDKLVSKQSVLVEGKIVRYISG